MPHDLAEMPASPAFTECVSENNSRLRSSNDSRQIANRLQQLIEQIQQQTNPAARALLQECLQSLLALYGDGLARMLRHVHGAGQDGQKILQRLLDDETVSGLLLIHGLHPLPLDKR